MKLPVVRKPLRTERELEMASKRDLAGAAAARLAGNGTVAVVVVVSKTWGRCS